MSTIPTIEPSTAIAGDTIQWSRTLSDYPASAGWVLSYAFLGSAGKQSATGTASGNDHLVTITAAQSALWASGIYNWQAYVTKGTERYTVGSGSITINQNYATILTGTDTRSSAQKIVDAINATLLGTASSDQRKIKIGDKEIEKHAPKDLLQLLDYYKAEASREAAADKINQGLKPGNKILTRF